MTHNVETTRTISEVASALDIPESVVESVARDLCEIDRLEVQRAGYRKIGMGSRFDADLDVIAAPHVASLAEFAALCAQNGYNSINVIEAILTACPVRQISAESVTAMIA